MLDVHRPEQARLQVTTTEELDAMWQMPTAVATPDSITLREALRRRAGEVNMAKLLLGVALGSTGMVALSAWLLYRGGNSTRWV